MEDRIIFAMVVIAIVAMLQGIAWACGLNGQIWAFTSLIIGAIAGAILGFTYTPKTTKTGK